MKLRFVLRVPAPVSMSPLTDIHRERSVDVSGPPPLYCMFPVQGILGCLLRRHIVYIVKSSYNISYVVVPRKMT